MSRAISNFRKITPEDFSVLGARYNPSYNKVESIKRLKTEGLLQGSFNLYMPSIFSVSNFEAVEPPSFLYSSFTVDKSKIHFIADFDAHPLFLIPNTYHASNIVLDESKYLEENGNSSYRLDTDTHGGWLALDKPHHIIFKRSDELFRSGIDVTLGTSDVNRLTKVSYGVPDLPFLLPYQILASSTNKGRVYTYCPNMISPVWCSRDRDRINRVVDLLNLRASALNSKLVNGDDITRTANNVSVKFGTSNARDYSFPSFSLYGDYYRTSSTFLSEASTIKEFFVKELPIYTNYLP